MKNKITNSIKIIFSLGILILFVYLLLRNVDYEKVKKAFMYADWTLIAISFLYVPISLVLRAWRWKYLLHTYKNISFANLLEVTCISRTLANILPFRAADVVQGVYLGRREKVSKIVVLASVLSERLVDLLFMFVVFVLLSIIMALPKNYTHGIFIVVPSIFCIFLIFIYNIDRIEAISLRFFPSIANKILLIKEGVKVFIELKVFIMVMLLTILCWLASVVYIGLVFYAFNINLSLLMIIAYLVIPAIATIVPSSPGFIGVWDFFAVITLAAFNIEKSVALSATTVVHFYALFGTSVFGLGYIVREWMISLKRDVPADSCKEVK